MRAAFAILALTTSAAVAQPALTPSDFDACKARRRELTAEAMQIADPNERGERLAQMPTCERAEDGTTRIVEAPPPPPPDTTPFAPHVTAGLRAGAAASAMMYGNDSAASGLGPFLELEAGWHVQRHVELAAFGDYSRFRDPRWSAVATVAPGRYALGTFDLREQLYDLGARLRLHYDRVAVAGGLGVELEHSTLDGMSPLTNALALIEVEGAYEVRRTERFAIDVLAIATAAMNPGRLTNEIDRDVVSARLAVGVRWR